MLLSYFIGQRYYPIAYPIRQMSIYVVLTVVLFLSMQFANRELPLWLSLIVNTLLIAVFVLYLVKKDLPLRSLQRQ
jgi:hypothetical protein